MQALHKLSDDQPEYQLRELLLFVSFLGMELEDTAGVLTGNIKLQAGGKAEDAAQHSAGDNNDAGRKVAGRIKR